MKIEQKSLKADKYSLDQPFVSVIVPVYNGAKTIRQCLDALLQQDYPPDKYEIIVVDNASKDETREVIAPYLSRAQLKLVSEVEVLNAYGARNRGANSARGEIFAFTDADCVAEREWLRRLLKDWCNTDIGVFIGDILPLNPATALERYYNAETMTIGKVNGDEFPGMRAGNCAIRATCFKELGGFRDSVPSGGDSDFLARMLLETECHYLIAHDATVYHKNLESFTGIFKRHLRFGTNMRHLQHHPYLHKNYVSRKSCLRILFLALIRLIIRFASLPVVRKTKSYRGRTIKDQDIFLIEPVVKFVEYSGLLIGHLLPSPKFR